MVHSKKEGLAPKGSQLFPFREDPFTEGRQKTILIVASPEDASICLHVILFEYLIPQLNNEAAIFSLY